MNRTFRHRVSIAAIGSTSIDASIVYPVAAIKASKNSSIARDYVNFLFSATAKKVFEKYGFSMALK